MTKLVQSMTNFLFLCLKLSILLPTNARMSVVEEQRPIVDKEMPLTISEETIKEQPKRNVIKRQLNPAGIETYFASHEEYNQWLKTLEVENPQIVTLNNIGKSYEGRDMIVLKFSTGMAKEAIFLEAGTHAREWLSITSVVWILKKMIGNYVNGDMSIKNLVERFDVYFLLVTNPDGYERTRLGGTNRLWRKNMMPVRDGCTGVDINRNFDVNFTSSGDLCDDAYAGSQPFDAPESKNIRDFVISIKHYLKLFISFHAYGQMVLIPWAYTTSTPPDFAELIRVAKIMRDTMFNLSRVAYVVGSPAYLLYPVPGTLYDWVKELGVKYSYSIEVRPDEDDEREFIVPVELIEPNGEELYAAVLAAAFSVI